MNERRLVFGGIVAFVLIISLSQIWSAFLYKGTGFNSAGNVPGVFRSADLESRVIALEIALNESARREASFKQELRHVKGILDKYETTPKELALGSPLPSSGAFKRVGGDVGHPRARSQVPKAQDLPGETSVQHLTLPKAHQGLPHEPSVQHLTLPKAHQELPRHTDTLPVIQGKQHAEDLRTDRERALEVCVIDDADGKKICVAPDIQFRSGWMVHMHPQEGTKGWRFHHLIEQGISQHPFITTTKNIMEADVVLWMPTSTPNPPQTMKNGSRFIVLDEGDGQGQVTKAMPNYVAYFKRSWVDKRDGNYKGPPRRRPAEKYWPMVYSSSDKYHQGHFEALDDRTREVVCSLRCFDRQPTRCRVLNWVKQAVTDLELKNSVTGEVNHGGRKEINKGYFQAMREARIVVTCNPSHWEGDFRFWEAMMSGALIFVDEMWVPQPYAIRHKEHVILYDTKDQDAFREKLKYYLSHPEEAREIARRGYLHALRYHRAVSRLDYFLRSVHEQELLAEGKESPYSETALAIKSDPSRALMVRPKPYNWARRRLL